VRADSGQAISICGTAALVMSDSKSLVAFRMMGKSALVDAAVGDTTRPTLTV
jgi:hypothetical protein